MLLAVARGIAELELRRRRDAGESLREIASTLSTPEGWIFVVAGETPDEHGAKTGIAVRNDGRVFHGLNGDHTHYTAADLDWLVPRSKFDFDRARAAAALG
jgi:hypothetical protein